MTWTLNQYQTEAVSHKDGPCLVTSCPGSGKTFVLVERLVRLIESGIPQKNILCLTFTNKAANEMKERICKRLNIKEPNFFIGTFHGLCAFLIRKLGPGRGYSSHFTILDEKDQFEMVMKVARFLGYELGRDMAFGVIDKLNTYRDQMEDFSWVKEQLTNKEDIEIAETYLERCRENDTIDFSGLISETIRIIEGDEEVKRKIQNTFKYILVDETQDTNKSQFYLINLLGGKYKNIMLIGDVDQSIYGWRGARYQNIREFLDMYPDCRMISLSKNYRSTPQIVKSAKKLIEHNTSHMGTPFETDNPSGEPIFCYSFSSQDKEAEWISNAIVRLQQEGGWDPSDIAVLYRMNKMSEPVEAKLAMSGIPYEVIGARSFYDRREIKDCLSMIRFLINPKDGVAFNRFASLFDGMGSVTIGKIEKEAEDTNSSILEICEKTKTHGYSEKVKKACGRICDVFNEKYDFNNPSECISKLIDKFYYKDFLDKNFGEKSIDRKDNLDQLVESSSDFRGDRGGLSKFLQQISLISNNDKENKENKVTLMSLHAAKGLEFPIVFMIGVEKDILPHKRSITDNQYEGLEEERRLCYVGMTRAKKVLYITWCKSRKVIRSGGNIMMVASKPSDFLKEAGVLQ